MSTLCFIVPAHGRLEIAKGCLRQLRRTCDALADHGIQAEAVVVADDENLDVAQGLGFATVERDNTQLGRKINDGYQAAAGFDFSVPIGSDDWVDAEWMAGQLPLDDEVRCSRLSSVVSEDGRRLARLRITYEAGDGVRVYPRALLARCGFRPCPEDRKRAIDTATWDTLRRTGPVRFVYHDTNPLQIVDFKSSPQLNPYKGCLVFKEGEETDPWTTLADVYPAEAITEMQAVYGLVAA